MSLTNRIAIAAAAVFIASGSVSCGNNGAENVANNNVVPDRLDVENPRIAVVSDLHFFDLSLLENKGAAFERYLASDRKLIEQSTAIADAVVTGLITEKPDVVIVCGDMTKDGERVSHEGVIARLNRLRAVGIKVLVTPGNHDINNPHSMVFDGAATRPSPSVTPDEFRAMYADFGFGEAIAAGPDLCYVSEPAKNLRVISIDACEYRDNTDSPVTKGSISSEKLAWVLEKTAEGVAAGKTVIGLTHHGVVEHYDGQKALFGEYVVDNWDEISTRLADAGMRVVFTGHYHAQDIRKKQTPDGGFIFDVQTGSTVTAPCPYRVVDIAGGQMSIASRFVESVDFPGIPAGKFHRYASDFLEAGMRSVAKQMLTSPPYNIDEATAEMAMPLFCETFAAHYAGDERQSEMTMISRRILSALSSMSGNDPLFATMESAIRAIWNDPAPADNSVTIDLTTGAAR